MTDSALLSLLRKIPLFAELQDDALTELARRCVARQFAAGQVLFTTGEECRGLYMIESGRVRIYRTDPSGREQVLHIPQRVEMLGIVEQASEIAEYDDLFINSVVDDHGSAVRLSWSDRASLPLAPAGHEGLMRSPPHLFTC